MSGQTPPSSNRMAVEQPIRSADQNLSLAEQADPTTTEMFLPSLDKDITLLDIKGIAASRSSNHKRLNYDKNEILYPR